MSEDRFNNTSSSYYFDGIDDFIWVGFLNSLQNTSQATISFWIKSDLDFSNNGVGTYAGIFGHWKHDGQFSGPIGLQLSAISTDSTISASLIGGQG